MCAIAAILLACCSVPVLGAQFSTGGELIQSLSYDVDKQAFAAIDTELKLYLERKHDFGGKLRLSVAAGHNALTHKNEILLDEAYVSLYLEDTDIVVGRQVISWGTADGINPTSYINPAGFSLSSTGLTGKPVLAAQATYYADSFDLTGVVVPVFVPLELSDLSSFAGAAGPLTTILSSLNMALPEVKPENMEWALKLGTNVGGYDLHLSYFHGWEDLPALIAKMNIDPVTLMPNPGSLTYEGLYRSVDKFGAAVAGAVKNIGVWAEAAYVSPAKLPLVPSNPLEVKLGLSPDEPYVQAVVGADHTFDNGLYAEAQYLYNGSGSLLVSYSQNPGQKIEAEQYLMSRLAYSFDIDNSLECVSIANLQDGSAVVMPLYTRSLARATSLKLGAIFFVGGAGEFSGHSTHITVMLKHSF
jgi:hypothetical protein